MKTRVKEDYQLYFPQYNKGWKTFWQWKYFKNELKEKVIFRFYPDAKKFNERQLEKFNK